MRSSAAERSRPTLWDGLVVLAVLAAAGALFFLLLPRGGNFLTARVVLNQEVVTEFPLSALTGTVTFDVPGAEYPITIEAEPGRIRVSHSDCPSQDCVRTGWVSRSGGQIVCLPNRLIITITGSDAPQADAVTG
ncbi:MAG TPA: NusG domain II-containing protein [Candidatus Intestinimonas pullistercoris]|uniref:NusG domain II-containing protein n=1 Tax=Candidatus Intestinimonas pullistercoris TaxID=2838623 RepID=A0A9D2SYS8_9FIRM|nr:NusG domain II-containing protein [uncultured Intestinimonas sp.]HJC40783.1 NusG domain II-containing protein [Candidatus Intestinimonas pullistercoris]